MGHGVKDEGWEGVAILGAHCQANSGRILWECPLHPSKIRKTTAMMLTILGPFIQGGIWLIAWTLPKEERIEAHQQAEEKW